MPRMTRTQLRRYFRHGTLTQLAAFEATARLGSCSKAAESLHLSQPAVSVLIKKLSEAIGLALFQQAGRKLELTAAGRALLEASDGLFDVLHGLEQKLEPLREIATARCSHCQAALRDCAGSARVPCQAPSDVLAH
jgi:LysR family transcriptional regulator, low CO2-responsive transcriptional regulator